MGEQQQVSAGAGAAIVGAAIVGVVLLGVGLNRDPKSAASAGPEAPRAPSPVQRVELHELEASQPELTDGATDRERLARTALARSMAEHWPGGQISDPDVWAVGKDVSTLRVVSPSCSESATAELVDGERGKVLREYGFTRVECKGKRAAWSVPVR